jgi:hypothetical protein
VVQELAPNELEKEGGSLAECGTLRVGDKDLAEHEHGHELTRELTKMIYFIIFMMYLTLENIRF